MFATNVFGVIAVTEAMLPLLRRSPCPRIVNLSSSVGSLTRMSDHQNHFTRLPGSLAYAPSKTALNQVTVQYAKQLRPAGILVNAADPGACATDFTAAIPGLTRTAEDGAAIAVRLATLEDDGPTGGYFADTGPCRGDRAPPLRRLAGGAGCFGTGSEFVVGRVANLDEGQSMGRGNLNVISAGRPHEQRRRPVG